MIHGIAQKGSQKLLRHQNLTPEKQEELIYGMECLLVSLIQLTLIFCIGVVLGKTMQISVFLATWIPVRSFAGGLHARNRFICILAFSCIAFASLQIGTVIEQSGFFSETVCILLVLLCGFLIGYVGPVEDPHKPLSFGAYRVFRSRLHRVLGLVVIAALLLGWIQCRNSLITMVLALLWQTVLLFWGKWLHHRRILEKEPENPSA